MENTLVLIIVMICFVRVSMKQVQERKDISPKIIISQDYG